MSTELTSLVERLRASHAVTYTFRVPWLRTLAFVGGFAAQMMVAWEVLRA